MVASLVFKLQLLPYYNQVSSRWPEPGFAGLANFVGVFFLIMLGFMIYGAQVQSFWEDSVTNASGFMGTRPVDWRLYRWPLGLVLAGVVITFTLFFRVEAYVLQGYRRVCQASAVQEYMDVRWKNLGGLDLRQHPDYPATFWFNDQTIWPMADRMPAGVDPGVLLTNAMNPGLGVRSLHAQGITGRGVIVGIIDQPLYPDHPEYAGKIAAYQDVGCNSESSMHSPGVTSLLVGKTCGTAPGARVYYVAAPSWLGDSLYFAQALEWLVRKNQQLPAGEKIRVVSVSSAPSGKGSPFKMNQEAWDQAVGASIPRSPQ
jgi:hypothetical protein